MEVGVGVIQPQDQEPRVTSVEEAGRNFQRRHAHPTPDAGLLANGVVKQKFVSLNHLLFRTLLWQPQDVYFTTHLCSLLAQTPSALQASLLGNLLGLKSHRTSVVFTESS